VSGASPGREQDEGPARGDLPHRLHQLRVQQGLTLRQMAAVLGLSAHSGVADFEAGRRIPHNDIVVSYERYFSLADKELQRLRQQALAARGQSRASAGEAAPPGVRPGTQSPLSPLEDEIPRELGGFRLLGRIGTGSHGPVYLGLTAGGHPAAVRLAHQALAADRQFRSRLAVEVAALGQLSTPWVTELIDADAEADRPWVAVGYAAGASLGEVIAASGPLPSAQVGALAVALTGAIADLRTIGVTHAGLAPGRIRLSGLGIQVVDSVLRRAAAGTAYARTLASDPAFLAPEQIAGHGPDQATDIFVLGVLLAYAATSRLPFGDGPAQAVRDRVLHEDPLPASVACADRRLTALIVRCLSKEPRERPALEEIAAAVHGGGPAVRPPHFQAPRAPLSRGTAGPVHRPRRRIRSGRNAVIATGLVTVSATVAIVATVLSPGARHTARATGNGQDLRAVSGTPHRYDAYACVDRGGPSPTVRLDPSGDPRDAGWRSSTPWPWGTPFCASQIWWAPYLNGGANPYERFSWIFDTSMTPPQTCLVWAYYPPPPSGHSGGIAHYMVDDGTGAMTRQVAEIDVNQSRYKGTWHRLGQYRVTSGTLVVKLDNSGTDPDPEQGPIAGPVHTSCY
jgi:transcriptional regulator with XRE-family HTH domain